MAGWFATPVSRGDVPPREELAIKVAVALDAPHVSVEDVIQRQRHETVRALQQLTRAKAALPEADLASRLLAESQIFAVEAEARWLDLAESMVHRALTRIDPPKPIAIGQETPDTPRRARRLSRSKDMSTLLELDNVERTLGTGATSVQALRGVSLHVSAGELVAVMGPSGSGKSTLLALAGGLETADRGRVLVDGVDLADASQRRLAALRRQSIGFVFQELNLVAGLTAGENVSLPLELDGTPGRRARTLAAAALAEVGLPDHAGRFPDDLSGGQQQRVAIARALVGDRRLVLADEPTGALDVATGDSVLALLRQRCDAGAGALLVTHEPRHAAWADRVVFIRDGLVVDTSIAPLASEPLAVRR